MSVPKELKDSIREAFETPRYRGVALLEWLGQFAVWHGNLSAMRDDRPRATATDEPPTPKQHERDLIHTLAVALAIEKLQPRCRETLWLAFFEGRNAAEVARELETTETYAANLITNCAKRVLEMVPNLRDEVVAKYTAASVSPGLPDAAAESATDISGPSARKITERDTRRH